jgi:hypothetical protein
MTLTPSPHFVTPCEASEGERARINNAKKKIYHKLVIHNYMFMRQAKIGLFLFKKKEYNLQ